MDEYVATSDTLVHGMALPVHQALSSPLTPLQQSRLDSNGIQLPHFVGNKIIVPTFSPSAYVE